MQHGHTSRKSGKWRGHYSRWFVNPLTGEKDRQQKCVTIDADIKTKTQANEELRKLIVRELGLVGNSGLTLKGFIMQRWQPLREGNWRSSTRQTNLELIARITDLFGDVPLRKVDNVSLQLWLNELAKTKSGSVVKHCRIFLRAIFAEALAEKYVDYDPARLLKVPKVKAVKRPYRKRSGWTVLTKPPDLSDQEDWKLTLTG